MSEFDPDRPCRVHDSLNDRILDWEPAWAMAYRRTASRQAEGVVNFDGRLLDGWEPVADNSLRSAEA